MMNWKECKFSRSRFALHVQYTKSQVYIFFVWIRAISLCAHTSTQNLKMTSIHRLLQFLSNTPQHCDVMEFNRKLAKSLAKLSDFTPRRRFDSTTDWIHNEAFDDILSCSYYFLLSSISPSSPSLNVRLTFIVKNYCKKLISDLIQTCTNWTIIQQKK